MITGALLGINACQDKPQIDNEATITILQTADIHAYLNPHLELFAENDQVVFRKAGGLATIKP